MTRITRDISQGLRANSGWRESFVAAILVWPQSTVAGQRWHLILKAFSLLIPPLLSCVLANSTHATVLLLTERNASRIHQWDSTTNFTTLYHSAQANDADVNSSEGSSYGWVAEHNNDSFARFNPGSGSGIDQQYNLGSGGRTHYAYPKHITVFDGNVFVMSRNDATIYKYDTNGNQLAALATGNSVGQGLATDGSSLFASFWTGSNSFFQRFDASLTPLGTIVNPSGMGSFTNIVDFAYDSASQNFFGLATNFENGTVTQSNTILEFSMGGSVIGQHGIAFGADGIGQFNVVPEPATIVLAAFGVLALAASDWRRRTRGHASSRPRWRTTPQKNPAPPVACHSASRNIGPDNSSHEPLQKDNANAATHISIDHHSF